MLNQFMLVGRLEEKEEIKGENNKKIAKITIAVPRSYKNDDGIYDTDFIKIYLYNGVAEQTLEYINKGDVMGVKGRIEYNNNEIELMAEKVSFISKKNTGGEK